jgi:hypothetical protein
VRQSKNSKKKKKKSPLYQQPQSQRQQYRQDEQLIHYHQHHHPYLVTHTYPIIPCVTYSKVAEVAPPATEIVYDQAPAQFQKVVVTRSPPSSSGLSSMADSDSDSRRSPECSEEDWSSNSGESEISSRYGLGDSIPGSRSPSPQKTGFAYQQHFSEAVSVKE